VDSRVFFIFFLVSYERNEFLDPVSFYVVVVQFRVSLSCRIHTGDTSLACGLFSPRKVLCLAIVRSVFRLCLIVYFSYRGSLDPALVLCDDKTPIARQ